ncbi:hypothetical protein X801_05725 [Opisthorchis viverrini]|uniref:snRNA-activating protein complex subunit 3 n=1 Tax=Opisthorchis viverrini TaxID=6198 RepID=A0A1S8WV59_OPIVI|nr:hypothetical protein X801_05725 [Opisthorchis viverrini]
MEISNIESPALRIGDLPRLYEATIPDEYFHLDEHCASSSASNALADLVSQASTFKQLQQDCSLESLFIEDDNTTLEAILETVPARNVDLIKLRTLEVLKCYAPTAASPISLQTKLRRVTKPYVDLSYKNMVHESPEATELLRDVFVTVHVHRPISLSQLDLATQSRYLITTQQIVLLGSNKLTQLRDAVKCPQDKVWLGDCSEALDDPNLHIPAERLYKSSYFFIENTFYDDLRSREHHSLSQPILEWIKTKPEFDSKGPFTSAPMNDVLIRDLVVHIGKPYHYVHQGNCEHVIVFTDIRLVDRDACQSPEMFPMLTGRGYIRSIRCYVCKRLVCRWIVSKVGTLLPLEPCPLCDVCLRLLLYDCDGKKIYPDMVVHMFCGEEVVAVFLYTEKSEENWIPRLIMFQIDSAS